MDLYKQYETEQNNSDKKTIFVCRLSIDPFMVIYFSNEQIELLDRLRKCTNGQVVAQIDSTGNLIEDLPGAIKG